MTVILVRPDLEALVAKAAESGYWQEHAAGALGWRDALSAVCAYALDLETELADSKATSRDWELALDEARGHYQSAVETSVRQRETWAEEEWRLQEQIRSLTERLNKHEASRKVKKILDP